MEALSTLIQDWKDSLNDSYSWSNAHNIQMIKDTIAALERLRSMELTQFNPPALTQQLGLHGQHALPLD